jgi:hypothetical protein
MRVDQRNSGTLRNRRLFKMKQEVSKRLQAAKDMYAIGKHPMEAEAIIKYETVLDELQKIRDSMTALAPKQWKDLSPTPEEIEARLPAMLNRLAKEAAQRVVDSKERARAAAQARDKIFEQMGVDPSTIPSMEKIKQATDYQRRVREESKNTQDRIEAINFLKSLKK